MMRFTVTLLAQAEGGYTVQCLEMPGAISEGETREEALENIADAIRELLEARREEARRLDAVFEIVEVDA